MVSVGSAEWITQAGTTDANPSATISPAEAETLLVDLAAVFLSNSAGASNPSDLNGTEDRQAEPEDEQLPNVNAIYRALVEQIPAVVFMAHLDRGIGEAYVSPQIEATLGFSQEEWLEDPIRWYQQIHPDDKQRWSIEAAQMFLSGTPLRSAYRVMARDGRVVWFHCEAKMIRRKNGRPWFIHGIAFDITELKRAEEALQEERNVVSAILHTVGALVVVLDPEGRIIRFNRACEQMTGYSFGEVQGKFIWDLFLLPEEADHFKASLQAARADQRPQEYDSCWVGRDGKPRTIAWSTTVLPGASEASSYVIASGIDITERKHMEKAILEISAREQRRIGQDLHDGLGQHLTGIAFMSKVQEQKLAEKGLAEAAEAARIVRLVNEAIHTTRELAHGLLPVGSDAQGLMSALKRWAAEVEDLFHISCRLQIDKPVLIDDANVSTHLYRIAQEAVNNAIRHGQAKRVVISLFPGDDYGILKIENDGCSLPEPVPSGSGMGMQIMNYRARMVGGSLKVESGGIHGVTITCQFPLSSKDTRLVKDAHDY
ncbi:MAG: PAS domain S-box protein [Candidatus Sulfotelmatobacter sp.]